jgi:hypothetical protein
MANGKSMEIELRDLRAFGPKMATIFVDTGRSSIATMMNASARIRFANFHLTNTYRAQWIRQKVRYGRQKDNGF